MRRPGVSNEVAKLAMRDPLDKPCVIEIWPDDDPVLKEIERVLEALRPPGARPDLPLCLTNPASWPRNVLDAVAEYRCSACNELVWISPSGLGLMAMGAPVVCAECFARKARELGLSDHGIGTPPKAA